MREAAQAIASSTQKGPKSNARTKMAEQLDTVPGTNVEVLATTIEGLQDLDTHRKDAIRCLIQTSDEEGEGKEY